MLLIYLMTVLIAGCWLARMIVEKKIIFQKTFLFWPLVLFFVSQFLATVFSIDRHTSLFGYYSRPHGGLLSTTCYLVLYWALVSNVKKKWVEKIINVVLISGALVAAYGVAEHFGIDKDFWVQDVQRRVFSTLGQPNWLAAYLNILLMLVLGRILKFRILNSKLRRDFKHQILNYFLLFLFYLCFLYTKSRSGFLGLIAGWLVFWILIAVVWKKRIKSLLKPFLFSSTVFFLLSLAVGTPISPSLGQMVRRIPKERIQEGGLGREVVETGEVVDAGQLNITPSGEIRKIVWKGAVDLWKQHPVFGTGTETFAYAYYWTRSPEHNLTSEWDFLYNKAHNEYLNFAATTGSLGLVCYLLIPVVFIGKMIGKFKVSAGELKKKRLMVGQQAEIIYPIFIFAALVTILVTNFFGFSVAVIGLWFFLLPGFAWLLLEDGGKRKIVQRGRLDGKQKLLLVALGAGGAFLIYQVLQFWWGDYCFQKGVNYEKTGNYHQSLNFFQKAVSANPSMPSYYDKMSLTLADLTYVFSQEDKATASAQLAKAAQEANDKALKISPYHLNFYRDRAKMFYLLSQVEIDYLNNALEAVLRATELAPTDAKLYYNAGLIYYSLGDKEAGSEYLKRAVYLKPNYDRAKHFLEMGNTNEF